MRPEMLRFANLVAGGETHHLLRVHSEVNQLVNWHRHDFAELFWLCEGTCRHETPGGHELLQPGDFRWLNPEQVHRLLPHSGAGFAFFNLAFRQEHALALRLRHTALAWAPFPRGDAPGRAHFSEEQRGLIEARFIDLFSAPRDLLHLERFLLEVLLVLQPAPAQQVGEQAPDWFQAALLRLAEPEYYCQGVDAVFRLCGRSREHVCRCFRKHLGTTPSAWINERRVRHAQRLLLLTNRSVHEVGLECGFGNPGHFHAVFKAAYGQSPASHRRQMRGGVGGG